MLQDTILTNATKETINPDINSSDRTKEVIVTGFSENSDADEVIAIVNNFLDFGKRRAKVHKVTTLSDPTAIGVIIFYTVPAKIGFYKKIRGHCHKLENGRTLIFSDNEPFETRVRNKTLGQIKFQINEKPSSIFLTSGSTGTLAMSRLQVKTR